MQASIGKSRGMSALADKQGLLRIFALDHESSMRGMLATSNRPAIGITGDQIISTKRAILQGLGGDVSGVLLDPHSYHACKDVIPAGCGVLLKLEEGWEPAGSSGRERLTRLHSEWTVERIAQTGAVGVKLMVYYRPDGSADVRARQQELAQRVAESCVTHDLVYALEPIGYPLLSDELVDDKKAAMTRLAQRRPTIVLESAREFSNTLYYADILKLDFPVDLRFVAEYGGFFDYGNDNYLYNSSQVAQICADLDHLCPIPWVIMSSGASSDEFVEYMRFAGEAGASGFICGAGLWKDALELFPDYEAMRVYISHQGVTNVRRVNEVLYAASRSHAAWPQDMPGYTGVLQADGVTGTSVGTKQLQGDIRSEGHQQGEKRPRPG